VRAQILAAFVALGLLVDGGSEAAAQALANPQGTAFTRSLAEEYKAVALHQRSEGDAEGAALFDRKADEAAAGTIVLPEDPASYRLGDTAANAAHLRRSLVDLEGNYRDSMTSPAAKAQANFDCWVYRLGKYAQRDKAASCRTAFMAAFEALLQRSMGNVAAEPGGTPTIYFDFDRAAVTWRGRPVIDQLLAEFRMVPPYSVEVVGYTDTAGSAAYNLALGMRRGNAVRDALIAGGVPASIITVTSKGMSDPAVATGPNVKDARNRRVEITPTL
jgi:OOP family OmpA-OmpF porin